MQNLLFAYNSLIYAIFGAMTARFQGFDHWEQQGPSALQEGLFSACADEAMKAAGAGSPSLKIDRYSLRQR
jgi:hypothetical protein